MEWSDRIDGPAPVTQLGRVVPELNDERLREIPAYSWRILYHLRHGHIYIVTLVHKRRQLGADDGPFTS